LLSYYLDNYKRYKKYKLYIIPNELLADKNSDGDDE
jgi:hypothetical protein